MAGRYTEQIPRQRVEDAIENTQGNVSSAAKMLGKAESTLREWVRSDKELKKFVAAIRKQAVKIATKQERPVPLEYAKPDSDLKLSQKKKAVYFITCHQNNTEFDKNFLASVNQFCQHRGAQLIVIPIRYKNLTAYAPNEAYVPQWSPELNPYYLNTKFEINENLVVLGDLKIQATAINPLSGLTKVTGRKSVIVGHPQIEMKMIPSPQDELPKRILSTGSCSKRNYSSSKAGFAANEFHTIGGIIVESEGNAFWTRLAEANNDGSFYDLDMLYTPDGHSSGHRALSLNCGDIHADFIDPSVKAATWTDKDSIVNICRPYHQFLHDVLDFYSANHHHKNNTFTKYAKHKFKNNNVEDELNRVLELHNEIWIDVDTYYHYVPSNHNDALTRWLNEADPKEDPENAVVYHKLMTHRLENVRQTETGSEYPDMLKYWLQDKIKNPGYTIFHNRSERVNLMGVDHSQHGDKGPNGVKGSISAFVNSGNPMVIQHRHTPGKEKKVFQGGTSSRRGLEYAKNSYSSWMHTHILQYPNGKLTWIDIINGKAKM